MKTSQKFSLALLAVGGALVAGYAQQDRNTVPVNTSATNYKETFAIIFERLHSEYLNKVDDKKLWEGAIQGMLDALDDPFTYYIPPENSSVRQEDLQGEFFGIGATLSPTNSDGTGATIEALLKGFPAINAGLQVGDKVMRVNGEVVTTFKLTTVVSKIRGAKDTKVTIEILRGSTPLSFEIVRQKVELQAVESTVIGGKVGYIAINTFANQKIFEQIKIKVANMKKSNINKLVLDMRDNGGGLLCGAVSVADQFLSKGNSVLIRDRSGRETSFNRGSDCNSVAGNQSTDFKGDMVVLVNRNSASASEIVSGALQDLKRATIIGEKTFGKGVAQSVFDDLPNGGEAAIVSQEWLTPSGRSIHKKGITPDIVLADSRIPKLVTVSGSNIEPNQEVKITVAGQNYTAKTDKDGNFIYTETRKRSATMGVQGQASVDVKNDVQLRKALEVLGVQP